MQVHEPMGLFEVSRMGKLIEVDFSQPRKRSVELAFSEARVLYPDFQTSMQEKLDRYRLEVSELVELDLTPDELEERLLELMLRAKRDHVDLHRLHTRL